MNMTPEERLNRMEAILDRLLRYEEKAHVHHMGLRSLFRTGVRRMDDLLDRQAQTDSLLAALMSSQLRTEESLRESQLRTEESRRLTEESLRESQVKTDESLRAMQASVQRLTETFQSYLESRKPKDDHPLQT